MAGAQYSTRTAGQSIAHTQQAQSRRTVGAQWAHSRRFVRALAPASAGRLQIAQRLRAAVNTLSPDTLSAAEDLEVMCMNAPLPSPVPAAPQPKPSLQNATQQWPFLMQQQPQPQRWQQMRRPQQNWQQQNWQNWQRVIAQQRPQAAKPP